MIKLKFISNEGIKVVDADEGVSILDVARTNGINLMGACEGACACGTCHIYIDEAHLSKIDKPSENEENVLDIVFNLQQNSRLACQVITCKELDGAIITIVG